MSQILLSFPSDLGQIENKNDELVPIVDAGLYRAFRIRCHLVPHNCKNHHSFLWISPHYGGDF